MVVSGYQKVENAFVDRYLTQEGETVEEAKERLEKQRQKEEKSNLVFIRISIDPV